MSPVANVLLIKRLKELSQILALFSVFVGITGLLAWGFQPVLLKSFLSFNSTVKINTAIILITGGVSLLLLHFNQKIITRALLLLLLLIVIAVFVETHFKFKQLILPDVSGYSRIINEQLPLLTAFYTVLMVSGLSFLSYGRLNLAQLFAMVLFVFVYATILGQVFGVGNFYGSSRYSAMDFPTALSFLLLAIGILFFHPVSGLMGAFSSDFLGSVTARYIFAYLLCITPVFVAFYLYFVNQRNFTPASALIFILLLLAIVTIPLAYLLINRINKLDRQLKEANNELMSSNQELWNYNNQLILSKDELRQKKSEMGELNMQLMQGSKELSLKNEELTRINENLDSLIHIISHDLKTPIVSLEGSVRLFEKKVSPRLSEHELQLLKLVGRSVIRLKATISDLTQVIRAQQSSNDKEDICFSELLNEVRLELEQKIHESGALIWVSAEANAIHYSRLQLKSILHNLLSNAIKYRSPNRYPVIEVKTENREGGIQLTFKDNGLGIPAANLPQLFTMFKRFHSHVEGTGLGLSIVKRIIENEGGSIKVTSEEGAGTTFTILFKQ